MSWHRRTALTPQELEQLRAEAAVALLAGDPPPSIGWPPPENVPVCRDCGGSGFGASWFCFACNGCGWVLP